MLDKDGYIHFISSGNWKLTKGSLVVAQGRLCFPYKTQAKVCGGQLNAVDDDIPPDLWHKQLAHMSEKGLQLLAKKSLIPIAYCLWTLNIPTFGKKTLVAIAYLESNT